MSLFFNSDLSVTRTKLSQSLLMDWREEAIPSVLSIVALPICIPVTVYYELSKKEFVPTKVEVGSEFLLADKQVTELDPDLQKHFKKLKYPRLKAGAYEWLPAFALKIIVTCAGSELRTEWELPPVKDPGKKRGDTDSEMPMLPFPSRKEFIARLMKDPVLYAYDVDRPIMSLVNPLFDIKKMSDAFQIACLDQNGVAFMMMDPVSVYGFNKWAAPFHLKRRKERKVILSMIGGRNLWAHSKFVVCRTATKNRAATLKSEKVKK